MSINNGKHFNWIDIALYDGEQKEATLIKTWAKMQSDNVDWCGSSQEKSSQRTIGLNYSCSDVRIVSTVYVMSETLSQSNALYSRQCVRNWMCIFVGSLLIFGFLWKQHWTNYRPNRWHWGDNSALKYGFIEWPYLSIWKNSFMTHVRLIIGIFWSHLVILEC